MPLQLRNNIVCYHKYQILEYKIGLMNRYKYIIYQKLFKLFV